MSRPLNEAPLRQRRSDVRPARAVHRTSLRQLFFVQRRGAADSPAARWLAAGPATAG